MERFLLSGASSSLLVMLSVAVFGAVMMLKLSSFKTIIAAALLITVYALLDSYKEGAAAVGLDGKLVATNAVCIDGASYAVSNASLFDGAESLTQIRDAKGGTVACKKLSQTK